MVPKRWPGMACWAAHGQRLKRELYAQAMEFNGNQRKLLPGVTRSASSLLIMLSVALIPYSAALFLGLQSSDDLSQRILALSFFP